MSQKGITSPKIVTVSVVRRALLTPEPGSAEARHEYETVFTTRAEVRTTSGSASWANLEIDGKKPSHRFTIRYTRIPFDVRDRLRDATGVLYQILNISNISLGNREFEILAAAQGTDQIPAAR